jgi:aerobic-type carbon monoxide dehydrogenase small subunit (CoxS/CutS family)
MNAVAGRDVRTVEGLGSADRLHPLQEAFVAHRAFQCGFCTPGMLMAAQGLLLERPNPTEADIVQALETNLCRCGAHPRIVAAVVDAARAGGGHP